MGNKFSGNKFSNQLFWGSFAILGLSALIFQVVFARNLALLFGLTAPAIATVLAVYFSGMALGSFIFGKLADHYASVIARRSVNDDEAISREDSGFAEEDDQRRELGLPRRSLRSLLAMTDSLHRTYTLLFLLTGLYGFFAPALFKLLSKTILLVNQFYPLNFSGFNFVAFSLSFLFLIFPAILFGAGFPMASKILIRRSESLGNKFSLLYFINTFGGVFGALFAGFWLIPAFGNNATIFLAAGANIIVAGLLFGFSRSSLRGSPEFIEGRPKQSRDEIASVSAVTRNDQETGVRNDEEAGVEIKNKIFLYTLFVTGFLALALEVFYTKTLILFIGSSTYAFSLVLIIFLLGIALGSLTVSWFIDRLSRGSAYFGIFLGLIGFWLFLTNKFFEQFPFWYLKIFQFFQSLEFSAILSAQFFLIFLVIFPATFLMGIIFPLGIKLAHPSFEKLGEGIGKLYFINTFGGVLGSLFAGFFLLPKFGYEKTLLFILFIYFLLGIFFISREALLDRALKTILITFLIFWGVFAIFSSTFFPWKKEILFLGIFPYAPGYLKLTERQIYEGTKTDKILFYKDGLSQVVVIKRGDDIFLRINGKTDASNTREDLEAEILIGALPVIFHPEPKEVLVVGLGSGITLGTIAQFEETEHIDAVEIDPAVVEAADYFQEFNHDVLNSPKVDVFIGDARNYLYLSQKKYDVISSEPSNPWVSGNAYLFSENYYELARSRLKENGLMLQWIHSYTLSQEDLKSVIKTFAEVFPGVYLFDALNNSDLFLVGSLNSQKSILDFSEVERKMDQEKIQEEFGQIFVANPYELLAYFTAGDASLRKFSQDSPVNTDNHLILEFSTPRSIYRETVLSAMETLFYFRKETNPQDFIIGGDTNEISRYSLFRQKLIPVQAALYRGDLSGALELYGELRDLNLFNPFIANSFLRLCAAESQKIEREISKKEAEKIWEKCEAVF